MNVLLLAIAYRAWSGSALSAFLRIMAAIATFSIETQLVTWSQTGSIQSLRLVNLAIAALSIIWHARRPPEGDADGRNAIAHPPGATAVTVPASVRLPHFAAVVALALVVTALALIRPVTAVDPYHLHRVNQITGRGTLAYDPAALDIKVNALAGVYELVLADLRIPGMATALVRMHGVFGLGFYLLALAAVAPWVAMRRRWLLLALVAVPVLFQQFVLVKNDLFGAVPAFVALTWVVARGRRMAVREIGAATALAGFAVGIKISSAPLALIVAAFIIHDHRSWRPAGTALAGGIVGCIAGGLLFTMVANYVVYGGAMEPYLSLGNRHDTPGGAMTGVWRFAISLADLGQLTPRVWPGRGGWGSTFGLPITWALIVLAVRHHEPLARRALIAGLASFVAFAVSYPDADLAHRMVLAPGLLLILAAVGCVDGDDHRTVWLRRALVPVLVLSALQIGRSAVLYLYR